MKSKIMIQESLRIKKINNNNNNNNSTSSTNLSNNASGKNNNLEQIKEEGLC